MHTAAQGEPDASSARDRFIAAYLIGAGICEKRYNLEVKNIPTAKSAGQTGCLIAFDTVGPDFNAASLRRGREWDGENFVPREADGKSSASTRLRVIKQRRQCKHIWDQPIPAMTMKKPWRRPITSARMMLWSSNFRLRNAHRRENWGPP